MNGLASMLERLVGWVIDGKFIKLVLAIWMIFICGIILLAYPYYFPPDFSRGFLADRRESFRGLYPLGFYAHVLTAPPVLIIGIVQMSRSFRRRFTRIHERLGQAYCLMILWAMAPAV